MKKGILISIIIAIFTGMLGYELSICIGTAQRLDVIINFLVYISIVVSFWGSMIIFIILKQKK